MPTHQLGLVVGGGKLDVLLFFPRRRGIKGEWPLTSSLVGRNGGVAGSTIARSHRIVVRSHFLLSQFLRQVEVFFGNELVGLGHRPQAGHLENVFSTKIWGLARLEGGYEGPIAFGRWYQVKDWSVGGFVVANRLAELASLPTQNALVPIILHPCFALVSHCLRFLRPMLGR